MRHTRCRLFLLPLFLVLACAGAFAQANSNVTGIVTDQTGAVVPEANISLSDPATGETHSTVSSGTGLYNIAGLNAANYNLKVTAKGFETFVQSGVVVNISATFRVDIKLTIGAESQTVTVQADALTVQADSNVVSTLINEQQISEIATNGRNVVGLAALGLGVSTSMGDFSMPTTTGANYNISFNGLNTGHNIYIIDGGEAYDRGSGGKMALMPSQDALSEFQVLASNYPPDYGISSGGTITMSIKSGTQKLHGEAWEFDRNDAFQGHNYFDANQTTGVVSPKPELRYNVYGFNVGGPVFIPHVYNQSRAKTFFFVNEEWRNLITGQPAGTHNGVAVGDNPTTAANFTYVIPGYAPAAQTTVFVPTTLDPAFNAKLAADGLTAGTPFPGNLIPGNLLDPNALLFNGLKNIPNGIGSATTYLTAKGSLATPARDDIFRIDHNINDKWALLGHFVHDQSVTSYSTVLWNADNQPSVGSSFSNPSFGSVIKLTGALTPNVLLEAAFNYDGNKINLLPVPAGGGSIVQPSGWGAAAGGTMSYFPVANNKGNRLPDIALQDASGINWGPGNEPWTNGAEDYNEIYALSVTKGKHAMKFGGGYNRYTKNQIIGDDTEGNYSFSDGWGTNAPSGPLTGNAYLDFDLGLATNYNQAQTDPINHYVNNTISAYAMDNWHVNSRLSLQYGLRYDALPHVWERNNQLSNFDPTQYSTASAPVFQSSGAFAVNSPGLETVNGATYYLNGIVQAGQNGTPRGMVKNFWKTYEPRFGFSYDVTGDGKTVVRGGFGTFFERIQGNDIYDIAGNAPFVNSPSANDVELSSTSYNWHAGAAATTPIFPQGPAIMDTYYPNPAVAMYSLGVQREIVPAVIWTTQYVGNMGWHQNIRNQINTFPLSTPLAIRQQYANGSLPSLTDQETVNYPGFGGMNMIENEATASYSGFQTGVRQQGRHGLSYEVDYTWSHEIDSQLGSGDLNCCESNPWNIKYDKGSGSLDRRHILNINYTYKVPFFAHDSGLTHELLGGWEVAGTAIWETGLPWAGNNPPTNNYADTIGLGGGYSNRAEITPGVKLAYPKAKVGGIPTWVSNTNGYFEAPTAAWLGGSNLGFGDAGRDAVVGPGRTNFSTSLYKSFPITERAHFEFRAESYNTFNHTQFANGSASGAMNTNPNSGSFGQFTGAADPRTFEFGGKFVF